MKYIFLISSRTGTVVWLCQVEPVEAWARLNISTLTPGLYYIKIQTAQGTAVQRVVKK